MAAHRVFRAGRNRTVLTFGSLMGRGTHTFRSLKGRAICNVRSLKGRATCNVRSLKGRATRNVGSLKGRATRNVGSLKGRATRNVGSLKGRPTRQGCRHGMTLLEVVFAVALLSVIAATVAGLFAFVATAQLRQQQRLAAAEVAHRMVLAYLDDPTEMPDSSLPLQYGPPDAPARFRWELVEERVHLIEVAGDQRETRRHSPLNPDRFRQVTVRAWLSEESGGSRYPDATTPMAIITRMIDPAAMRNPDSIRNMMQSPRALERFTQQLMGSGFIDDLGGQDQRENGLERGPRRGPAPPGPGARDAFRRGASGLGGQRVPIGQAPANASSGRTLQVPVDRGRQDR